MDDLNVAVLQPLETFDRDPVEKCAAVMKSRGDEDQFLCHAKMEGAIGQSLEFVFDMILKSK